MSGSSLERIEAQLAELRSMVINLQTAIENLTGGPGGGRTAYTTEEVAKLLNKAEYTVRQWCLEGRINATKRAERRGDAEVWSIPAEEIVRYKNEGLLPRVRLHCAG